MFLTTEYKPNYYIHYACIKGIERITWQGPDYQSHEAKSHIAAKRAITRDINSKPAVNN